MDKIRKIQFFKHSVDEEDILRASNVLRSIFLTTGDTVGEFETAFSRYISVSGVIGVTSCTAALHLSLLALDISQGDEVITTPMSFCATANAILHAGATPIFVDVEKTTGNIDANLIEPAITDKTKAIIPVHLYGQMCDMRKIQEIAQKYNLVLIEDAAHCIEGQRDGIKPGQLSNAACFSFYATKNITSGEGGTVATNNTEKADLLRMLRNHGIDKSAADRYTKRYHHWDMPILGWKYNMDNIHASLLTGQLARIEKLWERRNQLWNFYEQRFRDVEGVNILETVANSRHARHLFTILVDPEKRDSILLKVQEQGIGVAVNYRPIHLLQYYKNTFGYKKGTFPVAEDIGKRTISLPLYPRLTDDEAAYVVETVRNVVKE